MASKHVRAKCTTTGAIAALPERALELGMFPDWVKSDGPVPDRPKPAAFPKAPAADQAPEESQTADSESANHEEE
jgi:hypothetical protein